MKNLILIALSICIALLSTSCTKEYTADNEIFPEDKIVTISREFKHPTTSGKAFKISAQFDLLTESLVGYSVSQGVLDKLGMNKEELDIYLKQRMGSYYDVSATIINKMQECTPESGPRLSDHAACIEWCNSNKERGEGRGNCKFNCWVDTAIKIIDACIPG